MGLWFLNTYIQFPADRLLAVNIVYQASIITFIMQITQTPYNASIIAHESMNVYAYVSILEVSLKLLMVVFLLWVDTSDALITYSIICLLYTSDAADDLLCVDFGGRRIIKKKKHIKY